MMPQGRTLIRSRETGVGFDVFGARRVNRPGFGNPTCSTVTTGWSQGPRLRGGSDGSVENQIEVSELNVANKRPEIFCCGLRHLEAVVTFRFLS